MFIVKEDMGAGLGGGGGRDNPRLHQRIAAKNSIGAEAERG